MLLRLGRLFEGRLIDVGKRFLWFWHRFLGFALQHWIPALFFLCFFYRFSLVGIWLLAVPFEAGHAWPCGWKGLSMDCHLEDCCCLCGFEDMVVMNYYSILVVEDRD
jgi:hypothetical protein